jgi:hypothetical protein
MLTLKNFKNASISEIGSSKIKGGTDANTYNNKKVTWTGSYAGHSAEDQLYDSGQPGEHELCTVIVD